MSIFSKPKVVIYPQSKSTDIYIDRKENNIFSFEINLWEEYQEKDLATLLYFLKQNKIDTCSILIPDDVVLTKSFIYDTKIEQIEKNEVISLAESFVNFKINPESIEYILIQSENKTLIRAQIYDPSKLSILKSNLSQLGLKIASLKPVSSAVVDIISEVNNEDFFLVYPLNEYENTLILSKKGIVYLTTNLKGKTIDIQKIVNYSKLYFNNITKKIYLPEIAQIEIVSTTKMEQSLYSESQLAQTHRKPSNMPLPVVSELSVSNLSNPAIIDQPTDINFKKSMENKKNILPIVAVFIFTAALASIVIWYVLNRNKTEELENPGIEQTEVEEVTPTEAPIETPTPMVTVTELKKSIKIQVLNGTEINGQAATVKNMLTKLGFTSVAVGNSKETATENSVQFKSSLTGAEAYFESKLDSQFPATYTDDLKETSTYDVVFTIGTDLSGSSSSASTTTVTPTKKLTPTATKSATPTEAEEE